MLKFSKNEPNIKEDGTETEMAIVGSQPRICFEQDNQVLTISGQ